MGVTGPRRGHHRPSRFADGHAVDACKCTKVRSRRYAQCHARNVVRILRRSKPRVCVARRRAGPRRWPVMEVNRFGYIMERRGGLFMVVQLPMAPCTAVCQNGRRTREVASFPLMGWRTRRRSGEAGFELCLGPTTSIPLHRGVSCPT
jgi:hypothetical protein